MQPETTGLEVKSVKLLDAQWRTKVVRFVLLRGDSESGSLNDICAEIRRRKLAFPTKEIMEAINGSSHVCAPDWHMAGVSEPIDGEHVTLFYFDHGHYEKVVDPANRSGNRRFVAIVDESEWVNPLKGFLAYHEQAVVGLFESADDATWMCPRRTVMVVAIRPYLGSATTSSYEMLSVDEQWWMSTSAHHLITSAEVAEIKKIIASGPLGAIITLAQSGALNQHLRSGR